MRMRGASTGANSVPLGFSVRVLCPHRAGCPGADIRQEVVRTAGRYVLAAQAVCWRRPSIARWAERPPLRWPSSGPPRIAPLAGTRFPGYGNKHSLRSACRLRSALRPTARDARFFSATPQKNFAARTRKPGARERSSGAGGLRPPHRIAALGGGYSVRRPPVHTLRVRRSACTEFRCGPPWLSRPRRAKKSAAPGALSRGRSCRFFVGRGAKVAARAATRRPQKIAMKPRFFEAAGLGTEVWRVGSGGIAGLSPAPCAGRFAPDAFRWPRPALGCRMPEPTPLSPAPLASARFAGLAASGCRISKACRVQKSRYPPPGFGCPGAVPRAGFSATDTTVFGSHESLKLIWSIGEKRWLPV